MTTRSRREVSIGVMLTWLGGPRAVDGTIAGVLTVTTAWEGIIVPAAPSASAVVLTQTLAAAALFWRRTATVPITAAILLTFVGTSLATDVPENLSFVVVVWVAAYSVTAYTRSGGATAALTGCFLLGGAFNGVVYYDNDVVTAVISALLIGGPCAVGAIVRRQRELAASSAMRAASAEEARDRHAASAVANERARIARELHDVVSHAISVVVLQARGGRRMLHVDPEESRAAFDAIEQVAGQALAEMRRLLGLLRASDAADGYTQSSVDCPPQPSLRNLAQLVTEAGGECTVDLDVRGDLSAVPPSLDVTAYRIIQESLTNVRKHAHARSVTITIAVDDATLLLDVADDGIGGGPVAAHGASGFGIEGMRERASLFGGALTAGARPDGGFRVRAVLPLRTVPA